MITDRSHKNQGQTTISLSGSDLHPNEVLSPNTGKRGLSLIFL